MCNLPKNKHTGFAKSTKNMVWSL